MKESESPPSNAVSSSASSTSSSVGGGWFWDTYRNKFDEQRIDRLNQCRVLQEILQQCRRRRRAADGNLSSKNLSADASAATNDEKLAEKKSYRSLEDVPMGIRSVRYFHWRDMEDKDTGCVREEHALWNCRAIALGCGKDCVALRKCLLEYNPETILAHGKTAYNQDYSELDGSIACSKLQVDMKWCVAKAATELEERNKKSKA